MSTAGDNLETNSHNESSNCTISVSLSASLVAGNEAEIDPNNSRNESSSESSVQQSATSATSSNTQPSQATAEERCCWICFATEDDNKLAAWVQPCQCCGTTKWVHQSCLHRWIDEKQKGNALRSVTCQQCQTEYIIVYPPMGNCAVILEGFDNIIKRLSPFIAAGAIVGSIYWTAVTYGAVTVLQIVGHKKGLALMENSDPLVLLIGLPAIPVGLVLGRMIRWEEAVLRIIRNKRSVARKFPLMSLIVPYPDEEEDDQNNQNQTAQSISDAISVTRILCGALLLPTISSLVGRLLFESVENTLHRTLLGGLTFITVKGILKIYLKQQQYNRKKERKVVDYTPSNVQHYIRHVRHSNLGGIGSDRERDNLVQLDKMSFSKIETECKLEGRVLRRIIGAKQEGDQWRIRYNHELYEIFDEPEVSKLIRMRKLQWAGHVNRMDEQRVPKKIFAARTEGRRPVGKPSKRFSDSVDEDSSSLLFYCNL